MAKLKCEKCGSTDFVREGGYDVCQYCGAKYPVPEPVAPSQRPVPQPVLSSQRSVPEQTVIDVGMKSEKSWTLTFLLAVFFGYFGIHRFYAGKLCTGALWFCTAGCFLVGWLGDIWKIAIGKFTDSEGKYIRRN